MFENLSQRLSGVFDRLTKQGALSEDDVRTAMREVRVALLEADVSLEVARQFIKAVEKKATGAAVTKSITPGQQVIKIVHDELVHVLTGDADPGRLKIDNPPAPILMVGLQGSGKTTTTAKLAKRLKEREGKRVLMIDCDMRLPTQHKQSPETVLAPGLVEVITGATTSPGGRHEALAGHEGEIAILAWSGNPPDPETETGGVSWIRRTASRAAWE